MSRYERTRPGAFLAQAPRRKGPGAVAIELYASHSGFRFLSNFVFFGGLTLLCLALSSGMPGQGAGGMGSLFGGGPTALHLSAVSAPLEAAPVQTASAAESPAADTLTPITTQKAAALVQALDKAADANPAAPVLADYKLSPSAFADEPAGDRPALERAAAALSAGRSASTILTGVNPNRPGGELISGLTAIQQGGTANTETGFILLKRAADAGLPAAEALYGLARMVPPAALAADPAAGREWMQKAAESGDAQAARLLAQAYLTGAAGYAAPDKAQSLYRRAHELGDARASLLAAGLIARGVGGPADPAAAEQLIRIAADRGDVPAMTALGRYLTLAAAKGWSPSYDEAVLWLTRAADQGDLAAMEQLGDIHMFLAKSAPLQDPAKGFTWFRRCAEGGSSACHFALGRAYGLALGTSGDLAQAWAQLSLARDNGQPKAAAELESLETRLSPAQRQAGVRILAELKNAPAR